MHPSRRWRTSRSRARSSRMHHASYPVFVHRPAGSDWASSRPRLATTPLPFSLPSALRKPGHRTFTYEVTRHARRTRSASAAARSAVRWMLLLGRVYRSIGYGEAHADMGRLLQLVNNRNSKVLSTD